MSLGISPMMSAALAACGCGACAACAAKPVMRAVSVPVAEPATRTTADVYEPSGVVPPVSAVEESGAAATEAGAGTDQGDEPADRTQRRAPPSDDPEGSGGPQRLTADERRMITELQARDREVRAHEAAHQAAGGGHVGGASYSYQQGPDGRQYAIGGEVPVDLSTGGGSPEAVIAKMAQVQAAAMAPADPSPQDFAVAAAAAAIAAAARQQQTEAKEQDGAEQTAKAEPGGGPEKTRPRDPSPSAEGPDRVVGQSSPEGSQPVPFSTADQDRTTTATALSGTSSGSSRRASQAIDAYRVGGGPAAGASDSHIGVAIDQRA